MRSDAFATLYFFQPLRRLFGRSDGLPILMYHSISDRRETVHPYYRTVTSPTVFEKHMQLLHENGYDTLGIHEAVNALEAPRPAGRKLVAITFDDGFEDFYSNAFPVLNRYGFTATMYLPTGFIGSSPLTFKGIDCLTWSQVRELANSGIEFGSHTVTHPQLKTLQEKEIQYELQASKDSIEQQLGRSVTSFAYPYAFPETDSSFIGVLRRSLLASGYSNGVCTVIGTNTADDELLLRRLPVNDCDHPNLLRAKLEGGYDWLRTVQRAWKIARRRAGS